MALVVSDHTVTAGTATDVPVFTMTGNNSGANTPAGSSVFLRLREIIPTTTLTTGTDPSATTIAPGASATDVNQFTLQANTGTETVTSVTVNLSTNSGVGRLAITNSANTELGFTTTPTTGSNTISVSGMSAGTSVTTFKVRTTPLSHASQPPVPGGAYAITAPVTSWVGSIAHTGSDTNTNALTIDNASPADVSGGSASSGNAQVVISWANPADTDHGSTIVLEQTGSAITATPTEGTVYSAGNTIDSATVVCVATSSNTSCTSASLTNGTTYYYKIFTKDTNGNYSEGVIPSGSPATPSATTFNITATTGANGTITPLGTTAVAQGSSQTYTIIANSGYEVATLTVDGVSTTVASSYTFTNVQTTHTIDVTFSAVAVVAPTPDIGSVRPTSVTFSGKAFPGGKISIIDKQLNTEKIVTSDQTIGENGSFSISFIGVLQALHSFALLAKDKTGLTSQTKFFFLNTISQDLTKKDILIPPTIDIGAGQVTRGTPGVVTGSATPNYTIHAYLDGILYKDVLANEDGTYTFDVPTGTLDFGQHTIKVMQENLETKKKSDFSSSKTFIVSRLAVTKADLSGDGKIDIRDWSIFLFRFRAKEGTPARESIDFNSDGKVNIADFSIFIKTIRK